jgi:hypothetical protein
MEFDRVISRPKRKSTKHCVGPQDLGRTSIDASSPSRIVHITQDEESLRRNLTLDANGIGFGIGDSGGPSRPAPGVSRKHQRVRMNGPAN